MTLHSAAVNGDLKSVIDFHEQGISLDIRDDQQNTALHYAAQYDRFKVAEFLIDKNCDLNAVNSDGNTPLYLAVHTKHLRVANLLRRSGAAVTLHLACRAGWLDEVTTLVTGGECDVNAKDSEGDTPLSLAAIYQHKDIVEYLIESCAEINGLINIDLPWYSNWTFLHFACQMKWLDIVKSLLKRNPGVDLEVKTSADETPLIIAAKIGDVDMVQFLIESGADINFVTKDNWTLAHFACQNEWPDVIKTIVEMYPGYDLDVQNNQGYTPLLYAAKHRKISMVNLLLEVGADVKAYDMSKYTVLHFAVINRWPYTVRKCIEVGSDLNAQTQSGNTPLHLVCRRKELGLIEILLEAGADCNIKNDADNTALNVVLMHSHYFCSESNCNCPNVIRLLMNHGALFDSAAYELLTYNEVLKRSVLGDIEICMCAFINKYNIVDLPSIYSIPSSVELPSMKNLKLKASHCAASEIKKFVVSEIQSKGFCNVVDKYPPVLQMLSVSAFIHHNKSNIV